MPRNRQRCLGSAPTSLVMAAILPDPAAASQQTKHSPEGFPQQLAEEVKEAQEADEEP
jgi:hypothetical protein